MTSESESSASTDRRLPGKIMFAAFEGWNDAGSAASAAVLHLADVWEAKQMIELDPEDYHDFQVNRPILHQRGRARRQIVWPQTTVSSATIPGTDREVVLVHGIEPSMRWRSYCAELVAAASELDVTTIVVIGALLADVPHTRPVPVSLYSEDPTLQSDLGVEASDYEGPIGIVGVLQDFALSAGLHSAALWAAVPHYVAQSPAPKATVAILHRLEDLTGEHIPLGSLVEESEAWQRGVDELARDDEQIAEYVQQLEAVKDTAELPEASGEAIAEEFEKFLRRRGFQQGGVSRPEPALDDDIDGEND